MVCWFELLIPCFLVVLSVRECLFPIEIRQWCPIQIGVLPLGLNPDGFPFFKYDSFGLHLNRDLDSDFPFSKSGKDFELLIWDPGVSKYKVENGGIRQWPEHIYEDLSPFREMLKPKTRDIIFRFGSSIPQFDQMAALVHDHIDCDYLTFVMVLWRYHFGFCWIERSTLHLFLVNFLRQGLVGIDPVWRLKNGLAASRWIGRRGECISDWVLIDMKGSDIWADTVNFFVVMVKRITQSQYFQETLVRKCWCHYVSISELVLDTSALMLRFVKRSHSHKLLYTIRNKKKSNMKLDNNRSSYRLASKATLRKASSNSLLLYFLLVYGTYSCVCNNCVSLILYVFVITLLY